MDLPTAASVVLITRLFPGTEISSRDNRESRAGASDETDSPDLLALVSDLISLSFSDQENLNTYTISTFHNKMQEPVAYIRIRSILQHPPSDRRKAHNIRCARSTDFAVPLQSPAPGHRMCGAAHHTAE